MLTFIYLSNPNMCLILIWYERYIRINLHLTLLDFLLKLILAHSLIFFNKTILIQQFVLSLIKIFKGFQRKMTNFHRNVHLLFL